MEKRVWEVVRVNVVRMGVSVVTRVMEGWFVCVLQDSKVVYYIFVIFKWFKKIFYIIFLVVLYLIIL